MSVLPKLPETEKWCLQKCPICGRENYMVVRGDIEFDGRHEIFPDMGYSFCNCYNIFYSTHVGYQHPFDQLQEVFDTMPRNKEAEFILADPFFINWNNVYEFKHWKLRENVVIWDIDSFCDAAKEIGFKVLSVERQFNDVHPQTTMVVLGKPEPEIRKSIQAAKELLKDGNVKMVEVGVRKGDHAQQVLDNWPEIEHLTLVDAWKPYDAFPNEMDQNHTRDLVIDKFLGNEKVTVLQADSVQGSLKFEDETLDFAYIDADHSYVAVMRDVRAWLPKIRKGGIIGGHDYDFEHDSVKKAVHDIFGDKVQHAENSNGLQDWWVYL
jgi:hypothetical protein